MLNFQFLVAFIMDLSFRLSPPHHRRTSKFEETFSFLKGKSFSEIPLRTCTSNTMYDNAIDCRPPPWMYSSSRNSLTPKSFNDNDSPYISKDMVSKPTSASISFCQQTIVGGFVGSKNFAGGSFFGGRRQISDFLAIFNLELLSKDSFLASKSMSPGSNNTKIGNPSCQISDSLIKRNLSSKISDKVSGVCLSSVNIPESCITECVDSSSEKVLQRVDSVSPKDLAHSITATKESAEKISPNSSTTLKEKYSSVVNGTCGSSDNKLLSESSSVETSPVHEISANSSMGNILPPPKQSYAEVVKTIPPKPLSPQRRDFYAETQNYKKKLMRSKSNKCSDLGGRGRLMNRSTSSNMGDIIEGDTRWKSKSRFKKFEFKDNRPVPSPSHCGSTSNNASATRNSFEVNFCMAPESGSETGLCVEIREKEPLNGSLRRRCSSDCSLDSEDSFVVFASSPGSSLSSSPYSSTCVYPTVELEEESESDDESVSSSEYSSSEDDEPGDSVDPSRLISGCSSLLLDSWEFFKAETVTVPRKESKYVEKKKVRFAEGSALAVVRPMITWSFAYREARRGNWEVYSRDRARFQCRISNLAPVLNSVLDPEHRKRVFESRFVEV